jgi:excisionase family DNA binding protein
MKPIQIMYTREEAAEIMRISIRTLDDIMSKNQIKIVKIGRAVRITHRAIEEFIKLHEK